MRPTRSPRRPRPAAASARSRAEIAVERIGRRPAAARAPARSASRAPASARLEAAAPFGPPVFIFVAPETTTRRCCCRATIACSSTAGPTTCSKRSPACRSTPPSCARAHRLRAGCRGRRVGRRSATTGAWSPPAPSERVPASRAPVGPGGSSPRPSRRSRRRRRAGAPISATSRRPAAQRSAARAARERRRVRSAARAVAGRYRLLGADSSRATQPTLPLALPNAALRRSRSSTTLRSARRDPLDELRRARPRVREDQSRRCACSARAAGRLSRAADDLSVARAARHADVRRVRGPFRLDCDDPACPADARIWSGARPRALWRAAGRRGAPRDVASTCASAFRCRPGWAAAAAMPRRRCGRSRRLWRVDAGAGCARSAAAWAPTCRSFFEGGTVLGSNAATCCFRCADRPRRGWCSCCPTFGVSTKDAFGWWDAASEGRRRRPGGHGRAARATAAPRRPDGQRSGGAGRGPSSGNRPARRRAAARGRRTAGDVRQRLGGIRPVRDREARLRGRAARAPSARAASARWSRGRFNRQRISDACALTKPIVYTYRLRQAAGSRHSLSSVLTVVSRGVIDRRYDGADRGAVDARRPRRDCRSWRRQRSRIGAWPSGKARDFGSRIRRFESFRPSQLREGC